MNKTSLPLIQRAQPLLFVLAALSHFWPSAWGATIPVSVTDNVFVPASVTINVNDTIQWSWTGVNLHSSTETATTPLWDSGIHGNGFTFSVPFNTAGTYPYHCNVHIMALGTVTVQAANTPPTVSLTAPASGANFAAPWTGTIQTSSSDPGGSVARLEFFAGATLLGTITNPPASASLHVTNLAAGNYTLTAKATDNLGAITTSAGVAIHVLVPVPITLSSAARLSATNFQFNYTATPGLKYVVQRSTDFVSFAPLATNTAASSPVTFRDNTATGAREFYRVKLQPNP